MGLNWKNKVIQGFERQAHIYEDYSDVQDTVAAHLANNLPSLDKAHILEIGCGTGLLTKQLLKTYSRQRLHITDVSPRMIQQAKANVANAKICWSLLDAEKENTGHKYDLIAANMVCQWFEDFQQGIENVMDMLKPGGVFYFSLPGPESFKEWWNTLNSLGLSNGTLDFHAPKGIYREQIIMKPCQSSYDFLRSLKNLGAASARKNHKPLTVPEMKTACAAFDAQNFNQITWHILYGCITKK